MGARFSNAASNGTATAEVPHPPSSVVAANTSSTTTATSSRLSDSLSPLAAAAAARSGPSPGSSRASAASSAAGSGGGREHGAMIVKSLRLPEGVSRRQLLEVLAASGVGARTGSTRTHRSSTSQAGGADVSGSPQAAETAGAAAAAAAPDESAGRSALSSQMPFLIAIRGMCTEMLYSCSSRPTLFAIFGRYCNVVNFVVHHESKNGVFVH